MTENNIDVEAKEVAIPKYVEVENPTSTGNIFDLQLEDLIYEKMFIMFEKQMPQQRTLHNLKCELQDKKDKIISETDFSKVLGKSRTNQAEREAYMKPQLADLQSKIDELEKTIKYYENKIIIINDLIRYKRTQLKIQAEMI